MSMGAHPSTIEIALLADDLPIDTFDTMQVQRREGGDAARPSASSDPVRGLTGMPLPSVPTLTFALQARCSNPSDEARLLATVEAAAGGVDGFNR